jgi:hypothetical protein
MKHENKHTEIMGLSKFYTNPLQRKSIHIDSFCDFSDVMRSIISRDLDFNIENILLFTDLNNIAIEDEIIIYRDLAIEFYSDGDFFEFVTHRHDFKRTENYWVK